jgi:hypothetical protein
VRDAQELRWGTKDKFLAWIAVALPDGFGKRQLSKLARSDRVPIDGTLMKLMDQSVELVAGASQGASNSLRVDAVIENRLEMR